jgi:hypothetical protein
MMRGFGSSGPLTYFHFYANFVKQEFAIFEMDENSFQFKKYVNPMNKIDDFILSYVRSKMAVIYFSDMAKKPVDTA